MTDYEIRKEIRRRKNRRLVRRRIIIAGVCCIIAIAGGIVLGNSLGAKKYDKEIVITHTVAEDTPFINTAIAEVGNLGGDKFWKWFGFGVHQPWCACYVSWCEDQQGYIKNDLAPSFAMVKDGANWFQRNNQWQDAASTPVAGDLVFFDWESDGVLDHVGIITGVDEKNIYTVEGNSSDRVRQKRYAIGSPVIVGYGNINV